MLKSSLYSNLDSVLERIHVNDKYGDMERGIFIIRGENVVLLGEIVRATTQFVLSELYNCFPFQDREKEEQLNSKLQQISVEEILDAQRREIEAKQEKNALLRSKLKVKIVFMFKV